MEINPLFKNDNKCQTCLNRKPRIKQCCFCKKQLTGQPRWDKKRQEFTTYKCICKEIGCTCVHMVYCPICNEYFRGSIYLQTAIENLKVRFIANLVTHYRHSHITSWNKMWDPDGGRFYRKVAHFKKYDDEKSEVNERAKRQIIRKCTTYLRDQGITSEHFRLLESGSDQETLKIAESKLD